VAAGADTAILHAGGMDFGYMVFDPSAFNLIFNLAIPDNAFQSDELPLLESLGELREIPPGEDAVPLGAVLVFALVVLPAFLGCDVEDDVLFVVLCGFGFGVLSEAADEDEYLLGSCLMAKHKINNPETDEDKKSRRNLRTFLKVNQRALQQVFDLLSDRIRSTARKTADTTIQNLNTLRVAAFGGQKGVEQFFDTATNTAQRKLLAGLGLWQDTIDG
jgi:hypothetical protein